MNEGAGGERAPGRGAIAIAGVAGMLGVILGALGAHGPVEVLVRENGRIEQWETAVFYHLLHAIVLLVLPAVLRGRRGPWFCLLAGTAVFSGSLYALALTGAGSLGAVTPFGGVLLIAGWLWIALAALRGRA
jgi:uncharacterized membrane protein YgdD (TMEM256/DUF423 family)